MQDSLTPRFDYQAHLLSLLRLVVGILFIEHGAQKVFGLLGGHPFPVTTELGFAGLLEFVGGLSMLLGLFTRPVAFILAGEMAVAYFQAHFPHGFWPVVNKGELAVLYCFIYLYLVAAGAGPLSLDAVLFKGRR